MAVAPIFACRVLWGRRRPWELVLLADIIDAQEALRLGLVNWVVPADQLQDETQKLAERAWPRGRSWRMDW